MGGVFTGVRRENSIYTAAREACWRNTVQIVGKVSTPMATHSEHLTARYRDPIGDDGCLERVL
jgi:hypothetical protein